jgi:hypothetical protein
MCSPIDNERLPTCRHGRGETIQHSDGGDAPSHCEHERFLLRKKFNNIALKTI